MSATDGGPRQVAHVRAQGTRFIRLVRHHAQEVQHRVIAIAIDIALSVARLGQSRRVDPSDSADARSSRAQSVRKAVMLDRRFRGPAT